MAAKKRSDRISIELSMYLKYLHKREYVKIRDLWHMYPQLSLIQLIVENKGMHINTESNM